MTFSCALPDSVLVRFLCSLILWFVSEQVLALGCTAIYTYTNNGTNTNYSLSAGQSLKISRGVYTGAINNFPANSTICIESGATFNPSNINGVTGSLINYGAANLPTSFYNIGALIDNYGLLKFTSGLIFNGATTIRNRSNATIFMESNFTLANASLLENNGLLLAKQDFNTNAGTSVNNYYRLEAEGSFNSSGTLVNYGRVYAKKFINANSSSAFNNFCTLVSYDGFNNNSFFLSNFGTILVSSLNGQSGGLWQNYQNFYNGAGAKVDGGDFINYGQVSGEGSLFFSGETHNLGPFNGASATNPIYFYDESQTSYLLFDHYNTVANNAIRLPFARPTDSDAPNACNNAYKVFSTLKTCPANAVFQNQTGTVTQANANGAAVENVSQAIGALQLINATATASNSAKIISGGVLTLNLGQVVPADAPILISLARVDTARVKIEVSLDGVVFSNKGTFGSSGSLGTSALNVLSRLVINANPGGTQYVRLTREAGSMWVDGAEYSQACVESRDHGDAPASYGVASHKLVATNLYLGTSAPDAEITSIHSIRANGDGNDEDGPPLQALGSIIPSFSVLQMTDMSYSTTIRTTNQTGSPAKLSGWIDFDKNGSFDEDEMASVDVPTGSNNTNTTVTWPTIPTDITLGTTYVRLRFTTDAAAASQPSGAAPNGEVEDFILPIYMDIPPNSPSISIASKATPLACQPVIFQDDFNDLTPNFWGAHRAGALPIRSWTASGGGVDTYASAVDWGLGYGISMYFGNGFIRNISPGLGSGFSFDAQGKLLTTIDAIALRDTIDDLDPSGNTQESHWGVLPVTLSRSFATTVGKTYRLYFSALREIGDFFPGIMRVDVPSGSIHFKAPGGTEGILDYAIDFTATSSTSSISFVNYGHFGLNSSGYCYVLNNAWCTVGGLDNNGRSTNELSIDNVKLVEAACASGGIGGYVYQDANLNNTYDIGTETTIPAITVKIYDEKGSPTDLTDDRLVGTQSSFADGHYLFQYLDANASYRVEIDAADPDLPNDLNMGTPNPLSVLVPLVNNIKTANFGFDPTVANATNDYGDAPATYGMPQHTIVAGFHLGTNAPDGELTQPTPLSGTGDDATGTDDEDGLVIPPLTQGQSTTLTTRVTGAGGYLQGWIDWNGDGDFADAGEQVATNLQDNAVGDSNATAGTIAFTVSVPANAATTPTYARFRWSTTLGLDSTTAANNGEVEDYVGSISPANTPTILGEYRFDDCGSGGWQLDSSGNNNSALGVAQIQTDNYKSYACTAASNSNWNIEVPHQANYAIASGAVSILFYDHKGVWASARLLDKGWTADQKLNLELKPTTDWQHGTVTVNLNGNVIDTGETYYTSLGNGSLNDTQWVHAVLSFGPAGMKLYINGVLKGTNAYTGGIQGVQGNFRLPGVEGYFDEFYLFNQQPTDAQVGILYSNLLANKTWEGNTRTCNCGGGISADYGDAPATYGEASHKILSSIYLGDNPPDAETASKYSFNARADNYDDSAPRQEAPGVYIPLFPVLQLTDTNYSAGFKVTNITGTGGKLHGWIDFDKSGTFEADEAAVVDVPTGASNATATLSWATIPLDIQLGTVAMRVRLSTDASVVVSTPTGHANDGEVEDYPLAIAMDIPANSPFLAIVNGATPAACETVVFQDNFNDLTPGIFWGLNRAGSQSIRNWDRFGGGNDTYAHITSNSVTDQSVYFGNGGVRQISPSIGAGFSFDANGKLLTIIDAIALRDDMDDIISPGTTVNEFGSKADWGPEPVKLSRSFSTVAGKTYRLYFKATPEDPAGSYVSGIMRLDMPGGSIHFKAPGSTEGMQSYAVEFTATSNSSIITFVNYGHVENDNNHFCDPNGVFGNNVWCTVGGRTDGKAANELIIDDVILTEAACATGSIRGRVYIDNDQDNNYDAGIEGGISAITLRLYDENATPSDYSDDRLVNTSNTDVNGEYYFTEVNTDRSYRLEVDTTDSDLPTYAVIGTSNPLTSRNVAANVVLDNQNFGFDLPTSSHIVGTVYVDNNTNNSFDSGTDYGIGNITVSLHTMAGTLVATTQTAVNGIYQFANVDHNLSYQITVDDADIDLPPGATLGTVNPIPNITVPQNSTVTKDVGFDLAAAANGISGKVFEDKNYGGGVGRPISAEGIAGVLGVRVELYNASGAFVASTTTTNEGIYSFGNLASGIYYVRVVNDTIRSTRLGSNASERSIQTYRTDGTTAVNNEVGGRKPDLVDSGANTSNQTLNTTTFALSGGGQAQSVQAVTLAGSDISGANFGFNFSTVVNINDSGQGSLRQFILNANLLGDESNLTQVGLTAGLENSIFMIPGTGPHIIAPMSALPSLTSSSTVLNAATQAGASCAVSGRTLKIGLDGTNAGLTVSGLTIDAANVMVRGFAIGKFTAAGLLGTANADNMSVVCNNLGLGTDGTDLASNGTNGLYVKTGASNLHVGGNADTDRNLISGNTRDGIRLEGVANAIISGNYIGTDATGGSARSNNREGASYAGISVNLASSALTIRNNLISGNDIITGTGPIYNVSSGIWLDGVATATITGNLIGTDAAGSTALRNTGYGIYTKSATDIMIGGTTSAERNVISANFKDAINTRFGTNRITILGNYLGTDIAGTVNLGNTDNGIFLADTQNAAIGNSTAAGRNIIAGNKISGIRNTNTPGTVMTGNYIGLDASGAVAMGNQLHGVYVQTSANVRIGGSVLGDRNVIAANRMIGVFLVGATSNARVENNIIGLRADGNTDAGNLQAGIETSATSGVILHNNVVAANKTRGIHLITSPNTTITNNLIGLNALGILDRGNATHGIDIENGVTGLNISHNTISGNGGNGVFIITMGANSKVFSTSSLTGNKIGLASDGFTPVANDGSGIWIEGSTGLSVGEGGSTANFIAYNKGHGIAIVGAGANKNTLSHNLIYANTGLGIDLNNDGVTLNDGADADAGYANDSLNFPILQQIILANGNLTVRGCAPVGSVVELFEADVSLGGAAAVGANRFGRNFDYGEGQSYLGSFVEGTVADADTGSCVMPASDGNNNTGMKAFQFSIPVPASVVSGDYLTATATLAVAGTSEFGPTVAVIEGPPSIGSGSCAATGGSDILFIVDNSGSITEMEYADFAQTIQTLGSQLLLNNPKNRIAVAHFGGPSDSLVGGGQYVYIERDFLSTAMLAPVRQFAWGGAYNASWNADHLAGAIQQMRYALDGQASTASSYILSPLKETTRNTASPLQVVLMTDATRYLNSVPSDISMLIDPPGSGAEPDDGSAFTVYNQMKAEGVSFSVVSFNAEPTDIAASAAIASVGGAYAGAIEANAQDPQGSQATPRRYVSVTSGFQLTTTQLDELVEGTAICGSSIQGRVFEDLNYGGGSGRPFGTPGTVGVTGASIEVYDQAGSYVASVVSTTDGKYMLPNFPDAPYYVRVVDATVNSSRLGSNGSEMPVLTYHTDGLVATTNQVGGNTPLLADAGVNPGTSTLDTTTLLFSGGSLAGKPAQSVQRVTLSGNSVKEVDFGFNFSTVVNTNDSGQGSLRQFLLNNKQLATDSLAQVLPATLATEYSAGTETSIFMIPATQLTAGKALINLSSGALSLERAHTAIDGRTQIANIGSGTIVLDNSISNGLNLLPTATGSAVRDITVSHAAGSGMVLDDTDNVAIERVAILNNSQYGVSIINAALNNQVVANTIAHNTWAGIAHIGSGLGNTYSQNSIHDNGGLGIDLGVDGVTANDELDSDTGPNKLLNYPVVTEGSSISSNGTKVVAYDFDLDVPTNTQGYRVEFFRNTAVDSSTHGEGEIYLGYVDINHAGGELLNFKGSLNANQTVPVDANISVTLTEKSSPTILGSTSEFSGVHNGKVSVCTDLINSTGADMTVNENAPVITYLESTDENGNPITYVISGGADGSQFIVQGPEPGATLDCQLIVFRKPDVVVGARSASLTKVIPLMRPGDYEAPVDSGGDNTYDLMITATVNGQAYERPVTVGVRDINEPPAIINGSQAEFLEGKTGIAVNVDAFDPDTGDEEGKGISYVISGGVDRARFSLNAQTGELSFIAAPDFEMPLDAGNDNVYDLDLRVMDDQGLSSVSSLKIAVTDDKLNDGIYLQTKVLLQGPYIASTGFMQDSLRRTGLLPVNQPYAASPFNYLGTEQLNLDLATITGKDALVDWVLIELRDAANPNTILVSKAALVQRDGDVMDAVTGSSVLNFPVVAGNYFVSVRHRNHLGVRTATSVAFETTPVVIDFSQTTTEVAGLHARLESPSLALLWAGDINHDERLIAIGIGNDSSEILNTILKAPKNTNLNSSYRLAGYLDSDLNMDGMALFMGPTNDTNVLLGNLLLFPNNKDKNSNYIVVGGLAK